jgi:DNA repair photolyase
MPRGFHKLIHQIMGTWTVTPYRLCDYRCSYCCTQVQGTSEPVCSIDKAMAELKLAMAEAGPDSFWVIGGLGDAYPRSEANHRLTRTIMELVSAHSLRWCLVTKSLLVERDLDLLLAAGDRGVVTVSISSVDDAALARVDGFAPSASDRIDLVHRLRRAGVPVDVNALPFLPGTTDIEALIARLPAGVQMTVSPLLFGEGRDKLKLGGRIYHRVEVWDAYLAEYERIGNNENLSWIRPALPPGENNPFIRLPTLAAPLSMESALRRELRDNAMRYASAPVSLA